MSPCRRICSKPGVERSPRPPEVASPRRPVLGKNFSGLLAAPRRPIGAVPECGQSRESVQSSERSIGLTRGSLLPLLTPADLARRSSQRVVLLAITRKLNAPGIVTTDIADRTRFAARSAGLPLAPPKYAYALASKPRLAIVCASSRGKKRPSIAIPKGWIATCPRRYTAVGRTPSLM